MKFPHFPRLRLDLHSVAVQTTIELAAAGIVIVLLLRWIENS
jgi:hypothetical protein